MSHTHHILNFITNTVVLMDNAHHSRVHTKIAVKHVNKQDMVDWLLLILIPLN